jgi:hypothetical protein
MRSIIGGRSKKLMRVDAPFNGYGMFVEREPARGGGIFGMRQADQLVTACTKFILANWARKRKLKVITTRERHATGETHARTQA